MSLVKICPAFIKEKRLRNIMAEFNCTYRQALMIYVPPKEDEPDENYNKGNNPVSSIHDKNLFPKLATPRRAPLVDHLTVETEAVIHHEEECIRYKIPPRPKKTRTRRRIEEETDDFDYQFPAEEEPKQNVESERKENRDSGKFSELLSRLKEILFLRGMSFQAKINSAVKSCVEWLISVVAVYIPDWPILKVLVDYLMNNG